MASDASGTVSVKRMGEPDSAESDYPDGPSGLRAAPATISNVAPPSISATAIEVTMFSPLGRDFPRAPTSCMLVSGWRL